MTRYEVLTTCGTTGIVIELFDDLKVGDKRMVELKDSNGVITFKEMLIEEILSEEVF